SATLVAIAIAVPATIAPSWSPVATAQAATSISFAVFYDGLDDYGDWVSHDGDYVFVPVIDNRDWQPYTEGHWVYARGYGWTWVSDEPFGWATYHYGRWGFSQEIGWYWKPGTRWAPAWVSWRRSGNHVAWAPLPPHRGHDDDISITVNIGSIPDYYWVAVPSRSFLEVNLNVVIIHDDRERRRIVSDSEFVGSVQVENNIIVNNVINVNYVEENTGKKVTEVEVKQTDDPAKAKASDEEVAAFTGTVEADKAAKPPKLKEVGAVQENQAEPKKKIKADSNEPGAATTGEMTEEPAQEPASDKKKKLPVKQTEGQPPETQNQDQAATPDMKKKKPDVDQTDNAAPAENADQAVAPAEKKKAPTEQTESAPPSDELPVGSITKPEDQQAGKKKVTPEQTEASGKAEKKKPVAGEEPAVKKNKKTVPCDPAADPATQEGCVAQ
ncbi:MAG TPA: DUF6600 domain-containing protein, partial [Aestuariivirga sp.]